MCCVPQSSSSQTQCSMACKYHVSLLPAPLPLLTRQWYEIDPSAAHGESTCAGTWDHEQASVSWAGGTTPRTAPSVRCVTVCPAELPFWRPWLSSLLLILFISISIENNTINPHLATVLPLVVLVVAMTGLSTTKSVL